MRTLIIGLLILGMSLKTKSQNLYFTTFRFGELKLGMTLDSVNVYIENSIIIKRRNKEEYFLMDTIYSKYRNFDLRLIFEDIYDAETKTRTVKLNSIFCSNSNVQTKSGIKIGDDKFEIIKKLEGCYLIINPYAEKNTSHTRMTLVDKQNRSMIFYFENNLLIAIEIEDGQDDEC